MHQHICHTGQMRVFNNWYRNYTCTDRPDQGMGYTYFP